MKSLGRNILALLLGSVFLSLAGTADAAETPVIIMPSAAQYSLLVEKTMDKRWNGDPIYRYAVTLKVKMESVDFILENKVVVEQRDFDTFDAVYPAKLDMVVEDGDQARIADLFLSQAVIMEAISKKFPDYSSNQMELEIHLKTLGLSLQQYVKALLEGTP